MRLRTGGNAGGANGTRWGEWVACRLEEPIRGDGSVEEGETRYRVRLLLIEEKLGGSQGLHH